MDCRDVIDEEVAAISNPKIAEHYAAGTARCMDPKNAQWSVFSDDIGEPSRDTQIQFIGCKFEQNSNELDCYSDE